MKPEKIVLITGAARGIGAATALLAAQNGWGVVVNYLRDQSAADGVVSRIQATGGMAVALAGDVAHEDDVQRIFEQSHARFGRLDALVNNAGVVDVTARLQDMDLTRWRRMFDINVLGSMLCAKAAIARMSQEHGGSGGSIVNLSSAAAKLGSPSQYVDYAASKGAIDTLTIGLSKELAGQGIRVNAVRPGIIDTDIHASGGLPNRAREVGAQVPMQRAGSAMEVAQAIYWLMSDAASYVTGTIVDVTGGR